MSLSASRTLLIANPAAQNGNGRGQAKRAIQYLRAALGEDAVVLAYTAGPHHASEIAERAQGCQSVIALGGDGVIHEVAQGLLRRAATQRPVLGVIPVGSGNDYARSLGISRKVDVACQQLLNAQTVAVDVGWVNQHCFLETLSFGLDAAIARDSVERRVRTGRSGTRLYMESGINQLLHHLYSYSFQASFDGKPAERGQALMMAVQIGPYYGSGFTICPGALIDDGILDICMATPPVSAARALYIFLQAKRGAHTKFKQISLRQARSIHIEFEQTLPAQTDGECLEGRIFDISIRRCALQVLTQGTSAMNALKSR